MYLSRVTLKPDIRSNSQLGRMLLDRTYGTHRLLCDLFEQTQRSFLYREEIAKEQLNQQGAGSEPVYYVLSAQRPRNQTPLFQVQSKEFAPALGRGQRLAFRLRANPVVTRNKDRHDLVMDEQLRCYRQLCEACQLSVSGTKGELHKRLLQEADSRQLYDQLYDLLIDPRKDRELGSQHDMKLLLDRVLQERINHRLINWLTNAPSRSGIFSLANVVVEDESADEEYTVPAFEWSSYRAHPLPEKKDKARFLSVDMSGELIVHDPVRFLIMVSEGIGPAKGFGCGLMLIKPVRES